MQNTEFRMTHQRKVILENLKNTESHPSADEIYLKVRKILPHISLGTVYRNLETLSEMGLINKLDSCGNQRRYDGNIGKHYHIRCSKCGKVVDLPEDTVISVNYDHKKIDGFPIVDHTIQFTGICNECYMRNKSS